MPEWSEDIDFRQAPVDSGDVGNLAFASVPRLAHKFREREQASSGVFCQSLFGTRSDNAT